MKGKKAKELRKTAVLLANGKPKEEVIKLYKRLKEVYKKTPQL